MSSTEFTVKRFKDFLADKKIMGSRCKSCGAILLPRPICTKCGKGELEWIELKKSGTIRAYTVIHVPLSRMKDRRPFTIGVVNLDDGPSISGQILCSQGNEVGVGCRVEAEFVEEREGMALCFRPVARALRH